MPQTGATRVPPRARVSRRRPEPADVRARGSGRPTATRSPRHASTSVALHGLNRTSAPPRQAATGDPGSPLRRLARHPVPVQFDEAVTRLRLLPSPLPAAPAALMPTILTGPPRPTVRLDDLRTTPAAVLVL